MTFQRHLCIFAALLLAAPVLADDDPTVTGDSGLIKIFTARTVEKGKGSIGWFYDNRDRETGDYDVNDHGIVFGWGATERLEVVGNFVVIRQPDFDAPPPTPNEAPFFNPLIEEGVGDFQVGLKYRFVDETSSRPGVAIRGFIKAPTGDEDAGRGTGKVDGGVDLALSKRSKAIGFAGNLGYRINGDPDAYEIANEVRYGVGFNFPTETLLQGMVELIGTSYTGDSSFDQNTAADVLAGFQLRWKNGMRFAAAVQRNLAMDDTINGHKSRPDGVVAILSYSPRPVPPVVPVPPEQPKPPERPPERPPEQPRPPEKPPVVEGPFKDVYFVFDDTTYLFADRAEQHLAALTTYMNNHADARLTIEGNTCYIGTNEYNLALGDARARRLKEDLVGRGIDASRISTVSYGEERPAFDNTTEETRQFNRRGHFDVGGGGSE
jgi:peptidoglycan-associated lipoprotein